MEKASETVEAEAAARLEAKLRAGVFDLDDYAEQLRQMRRMGGMDGLLGLLPGIAKAKRQLAAANVDDAMLQRQQAILSSMTPGERQRSRILNGSRRRRIAAGSGTTVQEVNRLLKQHRQMAGVMKKMGRLGEKGLARSGFPGLPGLPGRPR